MQKLPLNFFLREDVVLIAKSLLGKYIFTKTKNAPITGGIIVETEGYKGFTDKACHAFEGKKTNRNSAMFENGGIAYVYLCYGIHSLLNVVTNKKNIPDAVLIRAIEPTDGIDIMLKRRNKKKLDRSLTAGPGSLTKALNVTKSFNEKPLNSDLIWIEDRSKEIKEEDIIASKRVGIDYAEEDAFLPWRFRIKNNKWTSIAK